MVIVFVTIVIVFVHPSSDIARGFGRFIVQTTTIN